MSQTSTQCQVSAAQTPHFNKVVASHSNAEVRILCGVEDVLFQECSAVFCGPNFIRLRMNVGIANGQSFDQRMKWLKDGAARISVRYVSHETGEAILSRKYEKLRLVDFSFGSVAGPAVVQWEGAFATESHVGEVPAWPVTPLSLRPIVAAIDDNTRVLTEIADAKSRALWAARGTSPLPSPFDLNERGNGGGGAYKEQYDLGFMVNLPTALNLDAGDPDRRERNRSYGEAFLNRSLHPLRCQIVAMEQTEQEDIVTIKLRRPR